MGSPGEPAARQAPWLHCEPILGPLLAWSVLLDPPFWDSGPPAPSAGLYSPTGKWVSGSLWLGQQTGILGETEFPPAAHQPLGPDSEVGSLLLDPILPGSPPLHSDEHLVPLALLPGAALHFLNTWLCLSLPSSFLPGPDPGL